jgi:hypothetical protein
MQNFVKSYSIGVPFSQLKPLLATPADKQKDIKQPGIPIRDSANNELQVWVRDAVSALSGKKLNYLIKADNNAKYPDFKNVLDAFKKNDIFKFQLVTSPEDVPMGTDLFKSRATGGTAAN